MQYELLLLNIARSSSDISSAFREYLGGHIISWLKDTWPDAAVLAGGPEAYSLGEEFLRETGCDYVVCGEGESAVLSLLRLIVDGISTQKSITGIKYIDSSGKFRVTQPSPLIHDLDKIPFPSKTVRLRSIKNVIAEIESVKAENHSLKYVNIYDDTFTLSMERVRDFCAYMKESGLSWTCEAHVLMLWRNPEMIRVMAESGLIAVQLGIESGSQRVLNAYNKHITPEMIIDVVRECKAAGLHRVEGNYIIGGAFESEDTIRESIAHAKKLITAGRGIAELNTVFFAPYHGTLITQAPELYGMCIDRRRFQHAAFTTKDELLRNSEHISSGRIINHSRLNAWRNYPYIMEFMRHLKPEENDKCLVYFSEF